MLGDPSQVEIAAAKPYHRLQIDTVQLSSKARVLLVSKHNDSRPFAEAAVSLVGPGVGLLLDRDPDRMLATIHQSGT